MRIIPVALFVILFLIIGIPVLGIEWLIGKISKIIVICDIQFVPIIQTGTFQMFIGYRESHWLNQV